MRADDAAGVARVRIDTWRAAYRGLVPDAYLDGLDVDAETRAWQQQIAAGPGRRHRWVAVAPGGGIEGFVTGGPDRRLKTAVVGEIYALYVAVAAQRCGLGRALAARMAGLLCADGAQCLRVWALRGNEAGRRFYLGLGAHEAESDDFMLGGARLTETVYVWDDPGML